MIIRIASRQNGLPCRGRRKRWRGLAAPHRPAPLRARPRRFAIVIHPYPTKRDDRSARLGTVFICHRSHYRFAVDSVIFALNQT